MDSFNFSLNSAEFCVKLWKKNENFNKRTQNLFKIRFKFLIKVLNFLKEMQAQGGAAIPQFNFNKKFPD